jgi:hypothetical protein
VDRKFQISYLQKYVTGKEERVEAKLTSTAEDNIIHVQLGKQKNLKISGPRYLEKQDKKKNQSDAPEVREIGYTEVLWSLLNLPYTSNTSDFIRVTCYEPADRCILFKGRQKFARHDRTTEIKSIAIRRLYQNQERRFTDSQEILIRDAYRAPYATDKVTLFGVRPPELSSLDNIANYVRWTSSSEFDVRKIDALNMDQLTSPWIDGKGKQIRIRVEYLQDVKQFLEQTVADTTNGCYCHRTDRMLADVSTLSQHGMCSLGCVPIY